MTSLWCYSWFFFILFCIFAKGQNSVAKRNDNSCCAQTFTPATAILLFHATILLWIYNLKSQATCKKTTQCEVTDLNETLIELCWMKAWTLLSKFHFFCMYCSFVSIQWKDGDFTVQNFKQVFKDRRGKSRKFLLTT